MKNGRVVVAVDHAQHEGECCTSPQDKGKGDAAQTAGLRPRGCDCGRPRYLSTELFADGDELCIDHNGDKYTLRITKQNKLILCK